MTFINSSKRSKIDDEIYKVKLMESYEERWLSNGKINRKAKRRY
jgi:hypothetical protein